MPRGVALMGLMKKSSAQEEYVTVSLHKGKRFLEQKLSIWPDNQTALTQMLILHHARGNVEILFIIPRSSFLSVNPTGVGLRFSANYLRGAAGAWTVKGTR